MPSDESRYPMDWLLMVEEDWKRAEQLLDQDDLLELCLEKHGSPWR